MDGEESQQGTKEREERERAKEGINNTRIKGNTKKNNVKECQGGTINTIISTPLPKKIRIPPIFYGGERKSCKITYKKK